MSTETPVYYSTAQVTDMVELSDQNVRKYVRMIEERGYEVTRDEYQRRLFSKADVSILKEMIRISKEPGFTLELAADEVMKSADEIIENNVEHSANNATNDDVLKALRLVVDKLEEMRQENSELHDNIKHLVTRLDSYDEHLLDTKEQQKLLVNEVDDIKSDLEQSAEKLEKDNETLTEFETSIPNDEPLQESIEEESVEENKASQEISEKSNSTVDMNTYQEQESKETSPGEAKKEEQVTFKPEQKKKGFFARLFGG